MNLFQLLIPSHPFFFSSIKDSLKFTSHWRAWRNYLRKIAAAFYLYSMGWIMEDFKSHGSHQHPKKNWLLRIEKKHIKMYKFYAQIHNYNFQFFFFFPRALSLLYYFLWLFHHCYCWLDGERVFLSHFRVNWILMRYFMVYKKLLLEQPNNIVIFIFLCLA